VLWRKRGDPREWSRQSKGTRKGAEVRKQITNSTSSLDTHIFIDLPLSYSTNPRKEIAKSRKIYFWDTGIRNALLGTFSTDELRPDIG
jgi:predicted AAA+ superfamily ATPase